MNAETLTNAEPESAHALILSTHPCTKCSCTDFVHILNLDVNVCDREIDPITLATCGHRRSNHDGLTDQ